MPSHRCGICNINYPTEYTGWCPVCGEELACVKSSDEHEDWIERAAAIRKKRGDNVTWERAHPKQKHSITLMMDDNEWLYVAVSELENLGYRKLETFDVVRVNDRFYELQGLDRTRGCWWIEEVGSDVPDAPE